MSDLFLPNKYTETYWRLIAKTKNSPPFSGCHRHHVIPRCLGGVDDKDNICYLTPREHYICHLLLTKMVKGAARSKMVYAFFRFQPKNTDVTNSRTFDKFVVAMKKTLCGEGNAFYGRKHTEESLQKLKKNHGMRGKTLMGVWTGKYGAEEAARRYQQMITKRSASMSGANNPLYGKPRSEYLKQLQSIKITGKKRGPTMWVTNGEVLKKVKPEELNDHLASGWQRGMRWKLPQ